jgi:hypothetical protein
MKRSILAVSDPESEITTLSSTLLFNEIQRTAVSNPAE